MGELPIAEELRQHGQRTGSKSLVDERLLPVESFDRRTAWQGVLAGFGVYDLGIKLADRAQSTCLAAVARVQRLTENVLPAGRIVAEVEPITRPAERAGEGIIDGFACGPRVHAPNHHIRAPILVSVE